MYPFPFTIANLPLTLTFTLYPQTRDGCLVAHLVNSTVDRGRRRASARLFSSNVLENGHGATWIWSYGCTRQQKRTFLSQACVRQAGYVPRRRQQRSISTVRVLSMRTSTRILNTGNQAYSIQLYSILSEYIVLLLVKYPHIAEVCGYWPYVDSCTVSRMQPYAVYMYM